MINTKSHIVMIETGEYSERSVIPYKVFLDKDKAQKCVEEIENELLVLKNRFDG